MKKLTIGITIYNNYPFCELLFEKLFKELQKNKTLKNNIDIIIVDDCSTNLEQNELLKKYSSYFTIYVNEKNSKTPAVGRNKIIEMALSEYVMFIDGDDYILTTLQTIIDDLSNKTGDVIVSNVQKIDKEGTISSSPFVLSKELFGDKYIDNLLKYTVHQTGIWSIYKVDYLKKENIRYDEFIRYEDNYFLTQLFLTNPKIEITKVKYYGWRTNYNGFSYTFNNEKERIKVYEYIIKEIIKTPNNQASGYLLLSIWNQTYGNLIRNYPRYNKKKMKKILGEYNKITNKYKKDLILINIPKSGFLIGDLLKKIVLIKYNTILILLLKFIYSLKLSKGMKTKIAIKCIKLLPIRKNKIFLTSHYGDYSDNSKYKYLELKKSNPEYKLIFAVKDKSLWHEKDFINYNNKLLLYYHFYISKIIYFNTWNNLLLTKKKNQKFIKLWHGFPYKKIHTDIPIYNNIFSDYAISNREKAISYWDEVVSVSKENTQIFKNLFPNVKIIEQEYSKVNWLIKNENNNKIKHALHKKYKLDINIKYTLYAPTYRPYEWSVELSDINKLLPIGNKLLVHIHPYSRNVIKNSLEIDYINLNSVVDIQEIILISNDLITDYSSIAYDFKKSNKKIQLFTPDKKIYNAIQGLYEQ